MMMFKIKTRIIRWILNILSTPARITGKNTHVTMLKKSPDDKRDLKYAVGTGKTPRKTCLKSYVPKIKSQGRINSCGSHAFCTQIEILQAKKDEKVIIPLSELFHYYVVRSKDYANTLPTDNGQYLRDGIKVCYKTGISPEKLWRYDVNNLNILPNNFAYSFAKFFRIQEYNRCFSISSMKVCLAEGSPVTFGMILHESARKTVKTGDITSTGRTIGGHAMVAIGYDDDHANPDKTLGAFSIVNSWGASWGDKGYGWVGYNLLQKNFIEAWRLKIQ